MLAGSQLYPIHTAVASMPLAPVVHTCENSFPGPVWGVAPFASPNWSFPMAVPVVFTHALLVTIGSPALQFTMSALIWETDGPPEPGSKSVPTAQTSQGPTPV